MKPKLVRDKIPDMIRKRGQVPETRVLDAAEYRSSLHVKLTEEGLEIEQAETTSERNEEIADALEVLMAIAADNDASWDEIERIRAAKHAERGGFAARIMLISWE